MTPFLFGQKLASQPSFFSDYMHQLNKFYNPWSKAWNEPARDGIEKGLQYAGRTAMGVGAGALAAAGGVAAAPAIASATNTAVGMGGAAASVAGAQMAKLPGLANNAVNAAGAQMAKLPGLANNAVNSATQFSARNPHFTSQVGRVAANDPGRIASSLNNPAGTLDNANNHATNLRTNFGL